MKKAGFTMIELIFVIVILGILAAVALPKFIGMGNEAHLANLKQFEGTLNRTVGPTAWAKVISQGGSLSKLTGTDADLTTYTQIPKEFTANGSTDANLADTSVAAPSTDTTDILGNSITCSTTLYELQTPSGSAFEAKVGSDTYHVDVCDGNSVQSPRFYIVKDSSS